jgi:hypothetical protein
VAFADADVPCGASAFFYGLSREAKEAHPRRRKPTLGATAFRIFPASPLNRIMKSILKHTACLLGLLFITTSTRAAEGDGYYDLFNGRDLSGWQGGDAVVEDGVLISRDGITKTKATFSSYELEFEFRLPAGGNSGIGIHYSGEGDPAYAGMEIQVLDDTAPKYAELKPGQYHGSLYLLAPAKRAALKPVGEWNHQRISVMGPAIKIEVNGEITLRTNLDDINREQPKHEGAKRRAGHIALCGHRSPVAYRNIRIREIPPAANVENVSAQGFKPLFDGKSLAGWKHHEGIDNWQVKPGIIKHTGKGGKTTHLWTEGEYGDFTLVFDWRWSGRGETKTQYHILPDGTRGEPAVVEELDSGILMRGQLKSQVNLWNWPAGSGEVWGYRTDASTPPDVRAAVTPIEKADRPLGEWNRMMITMKGEVLNVVLNGRQVIRDARLPDVPARGPIGLQHHGQAIDFANLWIKEH